MILSDYVRMLRFLFKFCGNTITSLPCYFCTEDPYSALLLGRTVSIVSRYSNSLLRILGQTKYFPCNKQVRQRFLFIDILSIHSTCMSINL